MSVTGPSRDGTGLIVIPCAADPLVSIVIPTTSQAAKLRRCLQSLARNLGSQIPVEVIVVMNAETDEIKSVMHQEVSGALVSGSPANLGVAGGNNRGRSLARGRYIALLHDDTEIEPLWLEPLVETAEARPDAGAVASMVLHPNGRLQDAGCILWREAITSPVWGSGEGRPEDFITTRAVDYSGTCSILVRADTWDSIGGLDERLYPAYYVDVDLCMAIRKQGQIVLCDPRSRLLHHRSSSSKPGFRHFIAETNKILFAEKWKAELADCESYAPDDPEAVQRARAHTEHVASILSDHWRAPSTVPFPKAAPDPAKQDAWHMQKERELTAAYIETLEQCIRLKQKLDASNQRKPLKWHRRLIRRVKEIWRSP